MPHVLHMPDVPAEGGRPWARVPSRLCCSLAVVGADAALPGASASSGQEPAGQDLPRLTLGVCVTLFFGLGLGDRTVAKQAPWVWEKHHHPSVLEPR